MIHTFSKETEDGKRQTGDGIEILSSEICMESILIKRCRTNVRFLSAINKMVIKPIPKSLNSVFSTGIF